VDEETGKALAIERFAENYDNESGSLV